MASSSQTLESTSADLDSPIIDELAQKSGYIRYIVCATCCYGIFILMFVRVNLNFVIDDIILEEQQESVSTYSNNSIINIQYSNEDQETDIYDEISRALDLSLFYVGFILSNLCFGLYRNRSNSPNVIGAVISISASFQFLTPIAMYFGNLKLISLIQFLDGICAAPSLPALQVILSQWTPRSERDIFNTVAFSGINVGIASCMCFSGILSYHFGWRWTFYVFGSFGIIWLILWKYFIKHQPEFNELIGQRELSYILSTRETISNTAAGCPFTIIMKSPAIWAIIVARFTYSWGFYTFLIQLPHFYAQNLGFNEQTNGFLCGLPFFILAIFSWLSNRLLSRILTKDYVSKTVIRKLFCFIGFFGQALLTWSITYVDSDFWKIFFITSAIGVGGITMTSFLTNHLEVAPDYAAIITGFCMTISGASGILTGVTSGYLLQNYQPGAWSKVFYSCAGIYAFGGLFYLLFGSSKKNSWGTRVENNGCR